MRPKTAAQTLCEPAPSKRMSRFHKSHFVRKFTGKMPRPRTSAHTVCEPVQSKHVSRFHKSHFMRQFAGQMPQTSVSMWAPWSSTGLHTFRKNPSVRTHCLGNDVTFSVFWNRHFWKMSAQQKTAKDDCFRDNAKTLEKKQCKIHISWWGISHDFIQGMWVPENLGAAPSYVYVYVWYILLYVTKCCCLAFWKERKRIDRKTMTKTRLTKRIQNGKERYSGFGEICPTHCVCLSEFAAGPEGICGSGICANFFLASQDH